jgi:D-glycero-D-manno-heptose 1,7-bisphosphate phosphatase
MKKKYSNLMNNLHNLEIIKRNTNVLILCGGIGSRISKITKKTAKPLIKVKQRPFLYYLIKNLSRYNFSNFYLLTYYKNEEFLKFKDKYEKKLNIKIRLIKEPVKLDTGGAVINAINKFGKNSEFILLNGDTYVDIDFNDAYINFKKKNKIFIPLIKSSKESQKLNGISPNKYNQIILSKKNNLMNSGIYLFNKKNILKFIKYKKCSFENLIIKESIKLKKVYGKIYKCKFIDIGSYTSLKRLNNFIQNYFYNKKTLFIDRDNTLIYDKGYTFKLKDLKLINKNIVNINKRYSNYLKIIITNQSGIARGLFNIKHFKLFMQKLLIQLEKKKIIISRILFCPHHKDSFKKKYKINCNFRKPRTGMIKYALKELEIKKNKNILVIGNEKKDRQVADKLKLKYLDQSAFL